MLIDELKKIFKTKKQQLNHPSVKLSVSLTVVQLNSQMPTNRLPKLQAT